jgi:putative hydrolase
MKGLSSMGTERIHLHTHTFFSDGELLPSELLRRAQALGYTAIGISDHGDASNLEEIFKRLYRFLSEQRDDFPMVIIPSVELTHVPPSRIATLARRAKELGAGLVVVHGETVVEPVAPGTNRAAVECPDVDILGHPGLITLDEARIAAINGVHLEITSRQGHSLANGLVAQVARAAGASLVVDTDTHSPDDLMDQSMAQVVARAAGLNEAEVEAATVTNPQRLVERAKSRMKRFHPLTS